MFLRANNRKKDGKLHRYWSVVESQRTAEGRVLQRQVLYLGEINDAQKAAWRRAIEVFADDGEARHWRSSPRCSCSTCGYRPPMAAS